nr:hypothetical protein [Tanacetum cinerariifolium]
VNPEILKSDFDFEEEIRLIENLLYDNSSPRPPEELNAEIADTIIESIPSLQILVQNSDPQREEIDVVTSTDDVLPPSVENEDDLSNESLLEEVNLFLASDNSIPPGIENIADDPKGDIRFLEELLINDSILSHESSDSNFEDNPSIPRPPEPPDAETNVGEEIQVVMINKDKFDNDYQFFMFDKGFSLLSTESEDTIFDPGFSEDVPTEEFKIYSNPLFDEDEINSDNLDPHCFNVKSDFVESLLNRDTFIDYSSKFDFSIELAHVNPEILKSDFDFEEEIRLIENLLYDNSSPRPPEELNAEIADTIIESIPSLQILVQNSDPQREEIDVVTSTDDVLPPSVENEDDLSNESLLEEVNLFLASDNSIPPGIENIADDPKGDIRFLEELLINDSILSHESSDSNFEDNPSIPRPPEPPDAETNVGEEIQVVMINKDKFDNDYQFFMFDKGFSLLSTESEDTIFDPGLAQVISLV